MDALAGPERSTDSEASRVNGPARRRISELIGKPLYLEILRHEQYCIYIQY
jgi:hypothetical protein